MASNNSLYITYIEKEGPFLKIWGQMDNNMPTIIEKSLAQMVVQFDSGHCIPSLDIIQAGLLCCAKFKDGSYYRCRITNTSLLHQNVVEVHFIDYGNRDIVSIISLRTIGSFGPGLITIPGQAKDFILANVTHLGSGWDSDTIQMITSEIRYMELAYLAVSQVGVYTLIKLFKNGEDVALSFFNRGVVLSIATSAQHVILQSMRGSPTIYQLRSPVAPASTILTQVAPPQSQYTGSAPQTPTTPPVESVILPKPVAAPAPAPPTLLTYKAFSLEPGSENNIYISYVSDGPCHFSVQLQKLEDTLTRLMNELNRMTLQPLEDDPIPGTVCVARCLEDQYICRAVVTSMVDGQFKVYYVDFGNTEVVPVDNLYQIPFKYVIPKVMAMRYALAGLERSSVTIEMKCAFKEFVSEKLLRMKALPPPSRSALPLCHLYDQTNVNVLDILKKAALLAYPEATQLSRGFSQEVRVSYVFSCSHFYVQIKSKDEDLRDVMAQLQTRCPHLEPLQPSDIKVGLPCCALFNTDGQWYRAQVLTTTGTTITVRYVDYGNEETVDACNLRMPPAEQVMDLRPQALECCLNGYQNMPDDLERDNLLEELILEQEFTMKVVEMQGNRALVDLIDGSRYNVGSLLLERLASAKSQVSPLLIQDSHHIEPRKRKDFNQQSFDRRPSRDHQFRDKDDNRQDFSFSNKPFRKDSFENNFESNSADVKPKRDGFNKDFRKYDNSKRDNFDKRSPKNSDDTWDDQNNSQWRSGDRNDRNNSWRSNDKGDKSNSQWKSNDQDDTSNSQWKSNDRDSKTNSHWRSNDQDDKRNSQWRSSDRDDKGNSHWRSNDRDDKSSSQWKPSDRDGNEKSFSDNSDNNWRRNAKNKSYGDKNYDDKDKRPNRKFGGRDTDRFNKFDNDHATVSKPLAQVTDPAPATAEFLYPELTGRTETVMVCWFHSPISFFCHLQHEQDQFKQIMTDIQEHYCNIEPTFASIGSPVVAMYPDDGVIYRARVLEMQGAQYQVQYVDFGNIACTEKVWPIENKFMQLPAQAISCSLNGITVAGEQTNLDQFAGYFDKDSFVCNFLSVLNNHYLVELTYDNSSLSEGLLAAGLVSCEAGAEATFDPSMLLGQQIKVTLKEMEGLESFSVALHNGLLLVCTLHNLADATWKSEETLAEYMGNSLFIYVDNVLEEKTEVTLYDTSGTKLKLIEPDEGAFDNIEVLCPMPVLYPTLKGWVAYLEPKEDKFVVYLHLAEYNDTLDQLLDLLFTHYNDTEYQVLEPQPDEFYVVQSADGNWYRGQVISVEQEEVTVKYVDYGNSETVAVSQLRELAGNFKEQHILTLQLLASGIDESYLECEVTANVWYTEDDTWEAEITKAGQVDNQAQQQALSNEPHISEQEPEPVQTGDTATVEQPGVPIILSHIDSPNEFYVQLLKDIQDIDALQENLQEQVVGFPDLESAAAGVLCAAPYSLDQKWYRAQVLDADADITTVRFVDYGNTDVLSNSTVRVKTLPPDLLSLEQYARRCSLNVRPLEDEWSPAAYERFEALTAEESLAVEIIHQEEKTTYVNLFGSDKNIADILVQENLAITIQLETESSCTGYVSHLNSPSEFWIQLENSVADLEWIAEQLSAAENFPELEDLTPGSLCAARFPEDEMWYRARILSNTVGGLEVLFIDYGNSCTCTGLRQLPEDLIMLPGLAQKCSLQKPSGILQWSAKATEVFKNISEDGATIFNIDRISAGETSIVRLLENEVDITSKLLPQTENVFISHFESISCFWLQKEESIATLNIINEELKGAADWSLYEYEDGTNPALVAALCPEREQWNRARITNKNDGEYEVIFIDYGDKSTVNDIRKLMDDTEIASPVAYEVKLEPLPGFCWNEESSQEFLNMFKKGVTLFQAEHISTELVRLYLNGRDVRMDIDAVLTSSCQNTPKKAATKGHIKDSEKVDADYSEVLIVEHADSQVSPEVSVNETAGLEKNEDEPEETNIEIEENVEKEMKSEELETCDEKTDEICEMEKVENKTQADPKSIICQKLEFNEDEKTDEVCGIKQIENITQVDPEKTICQELESNEDEKTDDTIEIQNIDNKIQVDPENTISQEVESNKDEKTDEVCEIEQVENKTEVDLEETICQELESTKDEKTDEIIEIENVESKIQVGPENTISQELESNTDEKTGEICEIEQIENKIQVDSEKTISQELESNKDGKTDKIIDIEKVEHKMPVDPEKTFAQDVESNKDEETGAICETEQDENKTEMNLEETICQELESNKDEKADEIIEIEKVEHKTQVDPEKTISQDLESSKDEKSDEIIDTENDENKIQVDPEKTISQNLESNKDEKTGEICEIGQIEIKIQVNPEKTISQYLEFNKDEETGAICDTEKVENKTQVDLEEMICQELKSHKGENTDSGKETMNELEAPMKDEATNQDNTLLGTTNIQVDTVTELEKCEQNVGCEDSKSELLGNETFKNNLEEHTEAVTNILSNSNNEKLGNVDTADSSKSQNEEDSKEVNTSGERDSPKKESQMEDSELGKAALLDISTTDSISSEKESAAHTTQYLDTQSELLSSSTTESTSPKSAKESSPATDYTLEDLNNLIGEPQEIELNKTNPDESTASFASCDSQTAFSDDDTPVIVEEERM